MYGTTYLYSKSEFSHKLRNLRAQVGAMPVRTQSKTKKISLQVRAISVRNVKTIFRPVLKSLLLFCYFFLKPLSLALVFVRF